MAEGVSPNRKGRGLCLQLPGKLQKSNRLLSLFCQTPKNGGQTLILSLGVVGCNDGNSSEFRKVTEEGYIHKL
ncbi:hypothetical protein MC7420_1728 [Coleofasciculus chthonoplastes PCC 7420]|uniref:Uncharacterized protein n=1 Tax=Coleofasciculus chthonoplastes PCC 7420 TaxID=118168 RepID=B4VMF2_9CYAN|nr:hypothetical protein [Coleofasciculus chthonoplastes]EDX76725.1 hypothetical protein MC7420_1728 [Coleofasciculus chthonoplastes PCC 7420]